MKYLKIFITVLYMIQRTPQNLKLKMMKKKNKMTQEEFDETVSKEITNWAKKVINLFGGKVKIYGEENVPEGPCLFVANHQGNFDIILLLLSINKKVGFVAKKEMEKIPVMSDWMKMSHCVFLDRENPREAVKTFNEATENLKNGYSMIIFPEGTRSQTDNMGEFKKGSLKLATKVPEIPIVPVACEGTYKLFESTGSNEVEIKVSFCKPIYLNDLQKEDRVQLSHYCQEIVKSELIKLR